MDDDDGFYLRGRRLYKWVHGVYRHGHHNNYHSAQRGHAGCSVLPSSVYRLGSICSYDKPCAYVYSSLSPRENLLQSLLPPVELTTSYRACYRFQSLLLPVELATG